MKIKTAIATLLSKTAKTFLLWQEILMKEPVAIVPKANLPRVKSVGKATWLSLLFAGTGQIYLGQVKKGWLLILLSIFGLFAIVVPGVIIIVLGMIDANVIAKRIRENGSVNEWEFFWNRKAKSMWKVSAIEPVGYSEKFLGSEPKRFYNSSPTPINQSFRVKREWSQSYSIEKEKARSTTSIIDPKITESAIVSRTVQDICREKYAFVEGKKINFEEDVAVCVPPGKNIRVDLLWKYVIENWVIILNDQYEQRIEIPISFIAKLSFDQRQFEFTEVEES